MFFPTEIIFSPTNSCNLHCEHCFVERNSQNLQIQSAKNFIQSCLDYDEKTLETEKCGKIEKIGFTGGEPFLYLEFLCEIIKFSLEKELLFDQIITNGDWWKDENDLLQKLQKLYNSGYDGKIAISYDIFHGQNKERIEFFIKTVQNLFGENSVNIQTVDSKKSLPKLNTNVEIFHLSQTFPCENENAWKSKHWFKDDFCEGPGQILYVHSNGKIAHCCGFANENQNLFIGDINQSFEEILENAKKNKMINIVYNFGLEKYRKFLKKQKIKFPGKTSDICSFCDFICKNNFDDIYGGKK